MAARSFTGYQLEWLRKFGVDSPRMCHLQKRYSPRAPTEHSKGLR
jgi:hypothetical protein